MEHLSDEKLMKEDKDFKKMIEMELMKRDLLFKALDCSDDKIGKQVGTDAQHQSLLF